jgi:hypothetical protein
MGRGLPCTGGQRHCAAWGSDIRAAWGVDWRCMGPGFAAQRRGWAGFPTATGAIQYRKTKKVPNQAEIGPGLTAGGIRTNNSDIEFRRRGRENISPAQFRLMLTYTHEYLIIQLKSLLFSDMASYSAHTCGGFAVVADGNLKGLFGSPEIS